MRNRRIVSRAMTGATVASLVAVAHPVLADAPSFPVQITAFVSACEGNGLASGAWQGTLTSAGWQSLSKAPADWETAFFPDHRLTATDLPWSMAALLAPQEMRSRFRAHWDGYDPEQRWFYTFGDRLHLLVWQQVQTSPSSGGRFLTQRCELAARLLPADDAWAKALMDLIDDRALTGLNTPPTDAATYRTGSYFLPDAPQGDIDPVSGTYLLLRREALIKPTADHLLLLLAADIGIAPEVTP
jgi:hypothetical protein